MISHFEYKICYWDHLLSHNCMVIKLLKFYHWVTTRLNNQLPSKVTQYIIGIDTHQYYDKSTGNRIESKILAVAPYWSKISMKKSALALANWKASFPDWNGKVAWEWFSRIYVMSHLSGLLVRNATLDKIHVYELANIMFLSSHYNFLYIIASSFNILDFVSILPDYLDPNFTISFHLSINLISNSYFYKLPRLWYSLSVIIY